MKRGSTASFHLFCAETLFQYDTNTSAAGLNEELHGFSKLKTEKKKSKIGSKLTNLL